MSTSTNIHCIVHNSSDWIRHIAFRDYLIERADVRDQYDRLKNELSQIDYKDMFEYNNAKNDFIKAVEKDAVKWYSQNLTSN